MKKKILSIALIASLVLSAAGCGETENGATTGNGATTTAADNSTTNEDNATEATATIVEETEEEIGIESLIDLTADYSEAKAKIDAFYEFKSDYKGLGVVTVDQSDCWICYDNYLTSENGGNYSFWNFYIINEDNGDCSDVPMWGASEDSELPMHGYTVRVGYGNFKMCAFYSNDDLGVYFYTEDEFNINESNAVQEEDMLVYHYNVNELIGEELTEKTHELYPFIEELEKEKEEALETLVKCLQDGTEPEASVLEKLTNIKSLDFSYDIYSGIHYGISDISVLKNFTNLENLSLGGNEISDISVLKELTNLKSLELNNNQISDISALKELTNLEVLHLGGNDISDISALKELTNLKSLELNGNQISDISALEKLINLEKLILSGNDISDISVLASLSNLTFLKLGDNKITDISPLANISNSNHIYIDLAGNEISDDDITALKSALTDSQIIH